MPYNSLEKQRAYRRSKGVQTRVWMQKYREDFYERVLLNTLKARSRKRGLQFNLELSDLVVPKFCPILGIELKKNNKSFCPDSPSVDRIDNTKGYVKGNVAIISNKANKMKSNYSLENFKALVKYMEQHNGP